MAAAGPLFDPASFNAAAPQAFYLWERREEMEAMADACLIVEGTRLPVHTQVLSLASGVLCRLFADLRGGSAGPGKRKADSAEQELTIEAPFAGFSVPDVALFLRLLYDSRWQLAVEATFGALHGNLAALLRLSHQLEAQRLLSALCSYMAGCNTTDLSLWVDWHEAADSCQLDGLRTGCLVRLAHAVAAWGGDLAPTLAQAAPLERCSPRTLAQLLAIVASSAARQRPAGQQLAIPAAAAVEAALAEADSSPPFEWALAAFSGQPAATGERVLSPTFRTAGHTWQLRVYPGGATMADAGHVSVRLYCLDQERAVRARFTIAVLDENGAVQLKHDSGAKMFNSWCSCGQLASREQLIRRGLLAGNSLRLRVTISLA